jgi:hypothetical protein
MATSKFKPAVKAPKGRMIHICCDRILTGALQIHAMQHPEVLLQVAVSV